MDGVALLDEARAAGLAVRADGDRLMIDGPPAAEPVALRLLAGKAAVLAALADEAAMDALDDALAVSPADEEWQASMRAAFAPDRHQVAAGCIAPLACSRLCPCERHARGKPCEGGIRGNAMVTNGAHLDCAGKLPAKPDIGGHDDPTLDETAAKIALLAADELAAYRAALADAPDDDPHIAHDRAALALAAGRGWVAP